MELCVIMQTLFVVLPYWLVHRLEGFVENQFQVTIFCLESHAGTSMRWRNLSTTSPLIYVQILLEGLKGIGDQRCAGSP